MKFCTVLFCYLIFFAAARAQHWVPVTGTVKKFNSEKDSIANAWGTIYKKDSLFIFVDKLAEKDFSRLFLDDTSAFDLLYQSSFKDRWFDLFDSAAAATLGISRNYPVVQLGNRIVKVKGNQIIWNTVSPNIGTPGCPTTITISSIKTGKQRSWKLMNVTFYCLIP